MDLAMRCSLLTLYKIIGSKLESQNINSKEKQKTTNLNSFNSKSFSGEIAIILWSSSN